MGAVAAVDLTAFCKKLEFLKKHISSFEARYGHHSSCLESDLVAVEGGAAAEAGSVAVGAGEAVGDPRAPFRKNETIVD